MKNIIKLRTAHSSSYRVIHSATVAIAAVALFLKPAKAEVIDENTTITTVGNVAQPFQIAAGVTRYDIVDSATLTFTRSGTYIGQSAGSVLLGAGATLIIAPLGTTGQVVFENSVTTVHSGAMHIGGANSVLDITNGIFRYNRNGALANSGVGGAISNTIASTLIKFTNVIFDSNGGYGNTGAIRITGTLLMTGGGFYNNWAMGDHTGALHTNGTPYVSLTNVTFDGNRARTTAGALTVGSGTTLLNNVIFTNNWAGEQSGAVRSVHNATGKLVFNMTESGGTNSYLYVGNFTSGVKDTIVSSTAPNAQILNNTPTFTALAKGGGFYFATSVGVTEFNIANDVNLQIGAPDAANRNYDTIASATTTANIKKTGGGDLIVNADNRYFSGTTTVSAGRFLLGNDEAKYGGQIIVSRGASFGGSGTVATLLGDETIPLTSVVANAGATIQVGLAERQTERLTIDGNLTLSNATLSFVAFSGTHAAKFDIAGTLTSLGSNIVNVQSFKTGTYAFGKAAADLYYMYGAQLSVNGGVVVAGGRHIAQVVGTNTDLALALTVDKARAMKWTGAIGLTWDGKDDNWESLLDSSIKKFAAGDTVEFDGNIIGDATITVSANMPVASMEVTGNNNIIFGGDGGIQVLPYQIGAEAEASVMAATGKLVKRGTGTITFYNGDNIFKGGIDIVDGGAIEFQRGEQIQTSDSPITFLQSATLRVVGDALVSNKIVIDLLKTAEIDTHVETSTTISGVISGGSLKKTGDGVLILGGANTHASTTLQSGTLKIIHGKGLGDGSLTIAGSNTDLVVVGGIAVPNSINMGNNSLRITQASTGIVTFSGSINGSGMLMVSGSGSQVFTGNNSFAGLSASGGASITPRSVNALGGPNSSVMIQPTATLNLGYSQVQAKNLEIDGATLSFNSFTLGTPLITLSGSLVLKNKSLIKLGAKVPSGGYTLATATAFSGTTENADYIMDPGVNKKYIYRLGFGSDDMHLVIIKPDVNPVKDIVAAFDTMSATMGAVYTRVSEKFLSSTTNRRDTNPKGDFWMKGLGTFAEHYEDDQNIGFKDDTYGILMGYDRAFSNWLLGGLYAGYTDSRIVTETQANTSAGTFSVGAYFSAATERAYATIDTMVGSLVADTLRHEGLGVADGRYKATVFGASAELGYALLSREKVQIKPSVSLHFMDYRFREHAEVGPGAMYLDDFNTSQLQGLISVKTTYEFTTAWKKPGMLDILMGWRRGLKDYNSSLSGAFAEDLSNKFHLNTGDYMNDAVVVGVGIRAAISKRGSLGFTYDYEVSKTHNRNTLSAHVCWAW